MKIKELLKNKWGWAGAILGLILLIYTSMSHNDSLISFLGFIGSPATKLANIIGFTDLSAGVITYPYFIILGFILGLILQKIYRRFK